MWYQVAQIDKSTQLADRTRWGLHKTQEIRIGNPMEARQPQEVNMDARQYMLGPLCNSNLGVA